MRRGSPDRSRYLIHSTAPMQGIVNVNGFMIGKRVDTLTKLQVLVLQKIFLGHSIFLLVFVIAYSTYIDEIDLVHNFLDFIYSTVPVPLIAWMGKILEVQ